MIRKLLPLSTLFVLAACSGDDDDAKPEDSGATTDTEEFTTTVDSGQGDDDDDAAPSTWTMTVPCDASHTLDTLVLDTEGTAYVDLDSGAEVGMGDAYEFSMSTWNITVDGAVEVAMTEDNTADFDSLCQAPPSGFGSTGVAGLEEWYDYSGPPDHLITPKDRVFFIKTSEGAYYRLKFDGYTMGADHNSPGITFGPIAPPAN